MKTRIQHPAYRIQNGAALPSNVTPASWHGLSTAVGKRTALPRLMPGSTRIGPDKSTQVVDFPLLSQLRVFWLRVEGGGGQWTVDNWQWIANSGNESNRTNGTNLARSMCKALRIVAGKSAKFHESARKSTKVRTDQARGYAIVRINPGGSNFLIMKPRNEENRNGKDRESARTE